MKEYAKPIDEMVNQLAPGQQAEVRDFVEFLLAKQRSAPRRKPQFNWAGALRDICGEYSSVDLQHEITRWRDEVE